MNCFTARALAEPKFLMARTFLLYELRLDFPRASCSTSGVLDNASVGCQIWNFHHKFFTCQRKLTNFFPQKSQRPKSAASVDSSFSDGKIPFLKTKVVTTQSKSKNILSSSEGLPYKITEGKLQQPYAAVQFRLVLNPEFIFVVSIPSGKFLE